MDHTNAERVSGMATSLASGIVQTTDAIAMNVKNLISSWKFSKKQCKGKTSSFSG